MPGEWWEELPGRERSMYMTEAQKDTAAGEPVNGGVQGRRQSQGLGLGSLARAWS